MRSIKLRNLQLSGTSIAQTILRVFGIVLLLHELRREKLEQEGCHFSLSIAVSIVGRVEGTDLLVLEEPLMRSCSSLGAPTRFSRLLRRFLLTSR